VKLSTTRNRGISDQVVREALRVRGPVLVEVVAQRNMFRTMKFSDSYAKKGQHAVIPHYRRLVINPSLFTVSFPWKALAWDDPRSNRGYVHQGWERVNNSQDEAEA